MADRKFTDYGDLNRQALTWLTEKNMRIHGSTGERSIDRLKVENLKPLPTFNKYYRFLTKVREVGGTIEILCDKKVIAMHQKCYTSRSTHYLEGQYQGINKGSRRTPLPQTKGYKDLILGSPKAIA